MSGLQSLSAEDWIQLLSGIHSEPDGNGEPDPPPVLYKVTVVTGWANIRRQPAIGNNIVKTAEKDDTFTTQHTETTDAHGNRWIQIEEGFIATHYNRTLRATIEVI